MTRAPMAAWRRLVAAGGAPAASHAVLACAPIPERLLDPMAGMRLVGQARLDALARPLDVAGVLARVLNARSVAETTTPLDADGSLRARRASRRVGSDDAAARIRQGGALHQREAPTPTKDGASTGADVRPPRPSAAPPAGVHTPARPRPDSLDDERVASRPFLPEADTPGAKPGRGHPSMGAEAEIGASTRVLLEAPHQDVQRLLARSHPTPPTAGHPAKAARPAPATQERVLAEASDRADTPSPFSMGALREPEASMPAEDGAPTGGNVRPPRPIAAPPASVRTPAHPRLDSLDDPAGPRPSFPATATPRARAGRGRPSMGTAAEIGATTRLLFEAPHPDVERLLAWAHPTPPIACNAANATRPSPATRERAKATSPPSRAPRERAAEEAMSLPGRSGERAEPTSPPSRATPERAPANATTLLARAVERVDDRDDPASDAFALTASRALVPARTIELPDTETRERGAAGPARDDAASGGGFRGLALRALAAGEGPRHIPVRLEREARAGSEIPLDDLDSRVAESLARILEREARRHGIDVTGARA